MKIIGLLSDTHAYIDDKILNFFSDCDEIWHAGDIGSIDILTKLEKITLVRSVYGNIDGPEIRILNSKNLRFVIENIDVWITHIGGYPGRYSNEVMPEIFQNPPKLFICGHSHILKIIYDKKLDFLHINPGAAGKYGLHTIRTAVKFEIENTNIQNLKILELQK